MIFNIGKNLTTDRLRATAAQCIAVLSPAMLLLDIGMAISFPTIAVPDMLHSTTDLSLDDTQASWFGSLSYLTQPFGAIMSGPIVDYFGRKKASFLVNIPHLLAWILMYYAPNLPAIFIANGMLGLGTGLMEAPFCAYVGEVSEPSIRGSLSVAVLCFLAIGIVTMYFLGTVVYWRQAALISLAAPITAMLMILLVLACLALDFLLIGLGMSMNFVTMVLPDVLDAKEGLSIDMTQASWFGSMAFLCQPLGSIFSGPLLDTFGRKKALFLVNIPHLIAWILMFSASNVPALFLANALLGIGTGIMAAPSVTYVGEISDPSIRGILTTLTNGFTATGMFVAYLLGKVLHWRRAALVSLTVPLATMLLVLFVPETPIWLISKGRQNEAMKSLCWLRGWAQPEHVQEEFDQLLQYNEIIHQCVICLKQDNATENCPHQSSSIIYKTIWKFKNVFLVKETMRPFVLVMAYFLFQTMSGFPPVQPNMVNLCKALGMKYDSKTIVVVVGAVFICMSMISATIVKLIGKRKLILGALFGTACCSLSISIYSAKCLSPEVFSYEVSTFPDRKELLPVVLFLGLVCFYSMGIPWILLSEVFPFRSRGIATSIAAALSYIIFFVASKTNYNVEAALHLSGTYAIYASFAFVGVIYLYFYLPETERKTLVEIEVYYKGNQMIFADDCFIHLFKKNKTRIEGDEHMLSKL